MSKHIFRGTPVSPGIANGTAFVLTCCERNAVPQREVGPSGVDGEIARFEAASNRAEGELVTLRHEVARRLGPGDGDIFAAQALVLRDHAFRDHILSGIRAGQVNAEVAVAEAMERFTRTFDQIPDAYLRERAADIRDVSRRVLAALMAGDTAGDLDALDIPEGSILVADELMPSATARFELTHARGFVTERGGKFSHTSILARSMRMPAVSGIPEASLKIKMGDHLIVDGVSGVVFVNPGRSVQHEYDRLEAELRGYRAELQKTVALPTVTADGTRVELLANASKVSDTEAACLYNADGIGLYRTEFAFAVRGAFPSEDEQYKIFKRAAERIHPRKLVLRLLDVGGDKELAYFPLPASRNPSLAQRGIRLLLKNPDLLRTQLRAFLRVSADHPISILLPVVFGVEEVRETRARVREAQAALTAEGVAFNPHVPIGAMIEVPSAAILVAALAEEVDFMSLGTNDLVQYVLAADREDETVSDYYRPHHPAVIRLIHQVAEAARAAGRPLTICGEMAGDPRYTELLVGLGLRAFSVAPGEMLEIKSIIRRLTCTQAAAFAAEALALSSVGEIEALLDSRRASVPTAAE